MKLVEALAAHPDDDGPAFGNSSGIYPTEFKVLVLPKQVEERTKGGIILPEEKRDRDQYAAMEGTLLAVSPLAFTYENWPEGAQKPQPGDQVIYAKYAGAEVEGRDGVKYRLINDKDIAAVIT